jgi:hypothetical protein
MARPTQFQCFVTGRLSFGMATFEGREGEGRGVATRGEIRGEGAPSGVAACGREAAWHRRVVASCFSAARCAAVLVQSERASACVGGAAVPRQLAQYSAAPRVVTRWRSLVLQAALRPVHLSSALVLWSPALCLALSSHLCRHQPH